MSEKVDNRYIDNKDTTSSAATNNVDDAALINFTKQRAANNNTSNDCVGSVSETNDGEGREVIGSYFWWKEQNELKQNIPTEPGGDFTQWMTFSQFESAYTKVAQSKVYYDVNREKMNRNYRDIIVCMWTNSSYNKNANYNKFFSSHVNVYMKNRKRI